ncbi:MAG: hypothetical protein V3573_11735 [Desulfovibrionaceae bacterium]
MTHTTALLMLLLFLFVEGVLLLVHHQTQAEKTRLTRRFLQMEGDKLQKKIDGLQVAVAGLQEEIDQKAFEATSFRSIEL